MHRVVWYCLLAFGYFSIQNCLAQTSPSFVTLNAGIQLIQAELAATPETRMTGLMKRPALAKNHGMLFIFDEYGKHCMWMRNTLIPLSVAFIADDGSITNAEDMQARTDDSHCAIKPVRYALEMELGWFEKHGILPQTGLRIQGLPASTLIPSRP